MVAVFFFQNPLQISHQVKHLSFPRLVKNGSLSLCPLPAKQLQATEQMFTSHTLIFKKLSPRAIC